MICEHCLTDHEGLYGSGRFCSSVCARSYSTSKKRKEINEQVSNTLKGSVPWNKGQHTGIKTRTFVPRIKHCTNCSTEIYITNKNELKTYCSDACFKEIKRKNAKGIKRQTYKGHLFDSAWEVKIAQKLDELNILFEIPSIPLLWVDTKHKQRKYFPDFYLPKHNIYLDPKNKLVQDLQKEKIQYITTNYKNVYIGDLKCILQIVESLTGVEPALSNYGTLGS